MNKIYTPPVWLRRFAIAALIVCLLFPSVTLAQNPLPAQPPIRDRRFGVVESYVNADAATAAGVGWTRVLFWWHQVQPQGVNDWNPFYFEDGIMNTELDSGRELVGLIAGTAPWASETGSVRAVPTGLYLPYDHPDNVWGQFVYRIVQRYQGQIDRWIIWNEPDVWDASHPGNTWDGSVEDYVQLLKVAYQATKAANGNAKIHLTATTYWWDVEHGRELYFGRLLDAIKADPDAARLNNFFDVATLHLYFKPEQVYDVTALYRQMLNEHGMSNKPLWINETNAPPSEDPHHPAPGLRFPVTLEEQSYFMVQAWAMGLAAGAERISLYKLRDEQNLLPGVEPYGLVRKDNSLRPAFWTYRALVTYLGEYQNATLTRQGNLRRVVVNRGNRGTTTVVWNLGLRAETMRVPATAATALLVDPLGPVETITAVNGQYTINLEASHGGDIGGKPYMIVEGAGAAIQIPRPDGATAPTAPAPTATAGNPPPAPPPSGGQGTVLPSNPVPAPANPNAEDWAIPGGRFYTQTGGDAGGYSVTDDNQARFYSELQRLGGLQTVGYPISRRYMQDGFVTQAFQKLVLQWRPEVGQAYPVNVFDELSRNGFDETLLRRRQTPFTLNSATFDPPGAAWAQIVAGRQALLNDNPAIRTRYFSTGDPLTVFGLPTSRVEDMGNHYALRTQRAVFQQWKETVPWARAGEVTIANGGAIAQELGWLPASALVPETVE